MKKTINIIITNLIVLLLASNAFAQESNLLLGGGVSAGISYPFYTKNQNRPTPPASFFNLDVGYEVDFIIEYSLNSKIGIQSGVKYVNWGYYSDKVDSSLFLSDPDLPAFSQLYFKARHSYIEIPLRVNYYLGSNKDNRFAIVGGISPTINFRNKHSTILLNSGSVTSEQVKIGKPEKTFNIVGEIGLTWNRAISERIIFFLYPNLRIQLVAEGSRRMLYSGVSTGIKLRL